MALTNLTKGTVVGSEGGSATTNLAQGLTKAWLNLNGSATFDVSDTEIRDSFNLTTTIDEGTGDYSASFTNNMANVNYSVTDGSVTAGTTRGTFLVGEAVFSQTASSLRHHYAQSTNANGDGSVDADVEHVRIAVHGDLA